MHVNSLRHLTHSHAFLGEQHDENERRTWLARSRRRRLAHEYPCHGADDLGGGLSVRPLARLQSALRIRHREARRPRRCSCPHRSRAPSPSPASALGLTRSDEG